MKMLTVVFSVFWSMCLCVLPMFNGVVTALQCGGVPSSVPKHHVYLTDCVHMPSRKDIRSNFEIDVEVYSLVREAVLISSTATGSTAVLLAAPGLPVMLWILGTCRCANV